MIPLLKHTALRAALFAAVFAASFAAGTAHTYADAMSVTITPPLFQLTIGPGEAWASGVKIVNNNTFDVTYYAQVVDMLPNGEDGSSKFIPVVDEAKDAGSESSALAGWITVPAEPIVVRAGASEMLPFSVVVPQNAEPGGHYAAILIGTQPGGLHATGTVLKVSSYVSSLLFVRIKGDVLESGRIREFTTSQGLYQTPSADFTLRFENTGNTHVRPQGDITIYNMWGRQRGMVAINQDADSNFGNVLPKSIRRFQFSWTGDGNPFDIGLYSAVVTLSYGDEGKQNTSGKLYFWVVPVVPVAIGLGTFVLFTLLFIWFIRRYIRRALTLEQQRFGPVGTPVVSAPSIIETLIEPVREGVIDLRAAAGAKAAPKAAPTTYMPAAGTPVLPPLSMGEFVLKYKLFFGFVGLLLIGSIGLWLYFDKVLLHSRNFQITDVHIQAENLPVEATSTGK